MDNCEKIRQMLEAYADGELTEQQKAHVEQHVAHCPHCAALLDEYLALNAAIADCAVQAPEGFAERVSQAIRNQPQTSVRTKKTGVRLGKIAPWIGIGAAALLCVSIASSSLVRFVTKNLADPDFSVDSSAGELQAPVPPAESAQEEESPTIETPTLPETEQEGGSLDNAADPEEPTYEVPTYEEPTYEAPTYEEPTYEETERDSTEHATTTPEAGESGDEQVGIPEQPTEAVTQPESQEPVTSAPTNKQETEADGVTAPELITPTPEPETEALETQAPAPQESATDAEADQAAPSGFFARVWQVIVSFFERLWQAVIRLFGGNA